MASALYAYAPTDPGDLALQPNDRIQVLEHMNSDCTLSFITQVEAFEFIPVITAYLTAPEPRVAWPK